MYFQFRLSGIREKKRVLYCKNPLCKVNKPQTKNYNKRTLISISYILGQDSEKQIYYICTECGSYDFSNFDNLFLGPHLDLKTYIVHDSYFNSISKMINTPGHQKCIFCKFDKIITYRYEYSNKSEIEEIEKELNLNITNNEKKKLEHEIKELKKSQIPIFETGSCTYKLFTNKPKKRNYIGYLCFACKSIYYNSDFNQIDWQRISQPYNQIFEDEIINPSKVWNEIYQEKQQNAKKYSKLKNEKTNPSNKIEKQEFETWEQFKLPKRPEKNETTLMSLGARHTLDGWDLSRPDRFTVQLDNLTLRNFIKITKQFGSESQKNELISLGYF